jgi:hypothetical protein
MHRSAFKVGSICPNTGPALRGLGQFIVVSKRARFRCGSAIWLVLLKLIIGDACFHLKLRNGSKYACSADYTKVQSDGRPQISYQAG